VIAQRPGPTLLTGALIFVVLVATALIAGGGTDLGPNTTVQLGLLAIGAASAAAVIWLSAPGRRWGALTVLLFAALVALNYASIAWSVDPGSSWIEANRTASYLAAFAAAACLARLAPERWRAMVAAVAAAAAAVAMYALATKVFVGTLDPRDPLGRLTAPLGYWNAIGLIGAMGIPAWLGAAAGPSSPRGLRILCPPAVALLIVVVLMSYSRGALVIAIIGCLLWFALVPLRLRALALLALGGAGGGAIAAWALTQHDLAADHVALGARSAAGHTFGFLLAGALAATAAAAFALTVAMERVTLAPKARRALAAGSLAALAMVPVGAIGALAASSRGLTGEVAHLWSTLTSPNGGVGNQPTRLLSLSNNRTRYWSDGITVGEHHPLVGAGATGFATAHLRYTRYPFSVAHAHNFLIETFADLGVVGVALSLALLVAWAVAAGRALGLAADRRAHLRVRAPPAGARTEERGGLITLMVVAIVFGLHNLIDWTWFIPGTAVAALACAGWLAGRGPFDRPVGIAPSQRPPVARPAVGMALAALAALLLGTVWVTLQPLRSSDADAAAIRALLGGRGSAALTDARRAVAEDPVALAPREVLATVYEALRQPARARAELARAVSLQPENPAAWQALGSFDLRHRHRPQLALRELAHALALNPASTETARLIAQAKARATTASDGT
jgi:hypothetical protein